MSDARWFEILENVAAATEHFGRSVELYAAGGFSDADLAGYKAKMALMHAMQSGHTSMQSALVRVLGLVGEQPPSGPDWHADLIARVSRACGGRPAVLPPLIAKAANETRRFRHVAMRSYGIFETALARPAVLAAGALAGGLSAAMAEFRRKIDGEPPSG